MEAYCRLFIHLTYFFFFFFFIKIFWCDLNDLIMFPCEIHFQVMKLPFDLLSGIYNYSCFLLLVFDYDCQHMFEVATQLLSSRTMRLPDTRHKNGYLSIV